MCCGYVSLISTNLFFISILLLYWGYRWHSQKCFQCILVRFALSIVLLYPLTTLLSLTPLFCLFVFALLGFEFRAYTLSHSTSPFFVMGFFQNKVLQTICQGWLWTSGLLISASWVARITGVSHRRLAFNDTTQGSMSRSSRYQSHKCLHLLCVLFICMLNFCNNFRLTWSCENCTEGSSVCFTQIFPMVTVIITGVLSKPRD
jgi:hypothetical protein